MAKIHKVEFYIADPNGAFRDGEDLIDSINNRLYEGFILCPKWKTSKYIEWYNDIDLNFSDCSEADCEKYFTEEENRVMNKLVILENSKSDIGGSYILCLPQGHTVLWNHYCSNLGWAYRDLQYNNSRKQILDDLFGIDNWEFVHFGYDDWTNEEDFWKFVDEQGKNNIQINLAKIDELKNHYKSIGGSY